jgi:hypothetical protein
MGWCGRTEIFDCVAKHMLNISEINDLDHSYILEDLLQVLYDKDWDNVGESDYWDHPVIGRILGNTFEEDEDE